MAQKKTTQRQKPKEKKNIAQGVVHIQSTFNNTIVSITDVKGDLISWASAGSVGFKGSRKGTPFGAQLAAEKAGRVAQDNGMRRVDVHVKGPGSGRRNSDPRSAGCWHRSKHHQRCDPDPAQRLPPPEAPACLGARRV